MYCPSCRSEFREGITHCVQCDVGLVVERPDEDAFTSPEAMAKALKDRELAPVLVGSHVALQEAQRGLAAARIASVIAGDTEEEGGGAPGMHARFYLMVDSQQVDDVRVFFQQRWEQGLATEGTLVDASHQRQAPETVEGSCPACGTAVPDDAEECPECELYLGK